MRLDVCRHEQHANQHLSICLHLDCSGLSMIVCKACPDSITWCMYTERTQKACGCWWQVKVGTLACQVMKAEADYTTCLLPPLGQQGLHAVSVQVAGLSVLASSPAYIAAAFQVASVQPTIVNPTGAAADLIGRLRRTLSAFMS